MAIRLDASSPAILLLALYFGLCSSAIGGSLSMIEKGFDESDPHKAAKIFGRIIEEDSDNDLAYAGRALARLGYGDTNGALADLSTAVELCPLFAEAYEHRASIRKAKGDMDGYQADLDSAKEARAKGDHALLHLKEDTKNGNPAGRAEAHLRRAQHLNYGERNHRAAVRDYRAYMRLLDKPASPQIFIELAGAQLQCGMTNDAVATYSEAIEAHPSFTRFYDRRAKLHEAQGNLGAARADRERISTSLSTKYESRLHEVNTALETNPESMELLLGRAELQVKRKSLDEALVDVEAILEGAEAGRHRRVAKRLRARIGRLWLEEAELRLQRDDFSGALAAIEKAMITHEDIDRVERVRAEVVRKQTKAAESSQAKASDLRDSE